VHGAVTKAARPQIPAAIHSDCAEFMPIREREALADRQLHPIHVFLSWPGLSRPSTKSRQTIIEIIPLWICSEDQPNLPSPWPMFHVLLALYCILYIAMVLRIDEPLKSVLLGKAIRCSLSMFPYSTSKIAGHAYV
jgi:hypothetical protein